LGEFSFEWWRRTPGDSNGPVYTSPDRVLGERHQLRRARSWYSLLKAVQIGHKINVVPY
jgi:hypothetical protein